MSNDIQKADQIAFHFYTKLFYVINQARATAEPRTQGKIDKWFNLETQDSDLFTREAREPYRNVSQAPPPGPPPLEIQVLLSIPDLTHNQVLVYQPTSDASRTRIEPTPRYIVLETFTLAFTPHTVDPSAVDVALPTIYKHGIPLFRSLFSLLRVLPAWKVYKRLKRRIAPGRHLGLQLRVRPPKETKPPKDILVFDMPASSSLPEPLPTESHEFSKVPHPLGMLALSVRYLPTPEFHLEELESVLSSRFISQDMEFVPTLTKHQRDASVTSLRNSATSARSPPKNIIARAVSSGGDAATNVADKFILPVRTASNPGASSSPAQLIQPARQMASGDFVGYGAPIGGLAQSPSSGLAMSRMRKESIGSASSGSFRGDTTSVPIAHNPNNPSLSSLSSSPSNTTNPLAIRRPNLNTVHPFKSNTVLSSSTAGSSSSPSLSIRQVPIAGSPLSNAGLAGPGQHSRSTSVSSTTGVAQPSSSSRPPHSPIGIGFARPSPPFPGNPTSNSSSSFTSDKQRPGTSGSATSSADNPEGAVAIPRRKRYSSSFGHRYRDSVGSVGSAVGAAASDAATAGGSSGRGTPANVFNASTGSRESPSDSANRVAGALVGLGISDTSPRERRGSFTTGMEPPIQVPDEDEDDISIFVHDIESRKPLSGRWKEREDREARRRALRDGSRSRSPLAEDSEKRQVAGIGIGLGLPLGQERERDGEGRTTALAPELTAPSAPGSRFSTKSTSSGGSSATVTVGGASEATVKGFPVSSPPIGIVGIGAGPSTLRSPLSEFEIAASPPEEEVPSTSPPALSMSPRNMPILTSQGEVEERLRRMNETFLKSLEGFAGNEAKRRERERRKEREKEIKASRQSPLGSTPTDPPADDETTGGNLQPFRGLGGNVLRTASGSSLPLGGASEAAPHRRGSLHGRDDAHRALSSPLVSPASPLSPQGQGRGQWANPYSLGMGLRRGGAYGEGEDEESPSGSALGSAGGEGSGVLNQIQGSEEVIGRMDIVYEGPRSGFRDRR